MIVKSKSDAWAYTRKNMPYPITRIPELDGQFKAYVPCDELRYNLGDFKKCRFVIWEKEDMILLSYPTGTMTIKIKPTMCFVYRVFVKGVYLHHATSRIILDGIFTQYINEEERKILNEYIDFGEQELRQEKYEKHVSRVSCLEVITFITYTID